MNPLNNKFFKLALAKAASLAGKNGRIILLLGKLGDKMRSVNWSAINRSEVKDKFLLLSRMTKAYTLGRYREVPWKTVLVMLAAFLYFINPIDLIPDFIPGLGLTDDFGVLLWVYNSISVEVEKFVTWEKSQVTTS
ncbi:MAG: DUF1232 domain-containing protein [Cyclobacteriaceae bacterium]|nr:DUF1232 domain-containing protein [Cyclobacteriaceae bacterium]